MKLRTVLISAGAALLVAGIAYAVQLTLMTQPDMIVTVRLPGTWGLNTEITRRLDPALVDASMRNLKFTDDPTVLGRLQTISDRLKNRSIYMSGLITINDRTHPYIITNTNGNPQLIWFTPDRADPLGHTNTMNVSIAPSRDSTQDILFIGGEAPRGAAAAYDRTR